MTLHGPSTTTPPSPSTPASTAPIDHGERARVAELRGEAQSTTDRTQKAALLYEAGYLTEAVLHQPAHAVQDYLAAYNSDSRSRLPLYALLRMFERRSSYKNLARLYDAELRGARSPHEKAIALVDLAGLDLIHAGDPQAATARLTRALPHDVTGEAALLLEWNRRADNDLDAASKALAARAELCDDPMQRGVLLLEVAHMHEQAGDLRAALGALQSAALVKPGHEIFLVALTRFARLHGFTSELVEANERRAELISEELSERLVDATPDLPLIELLRSRAVALWYEAARLRCTTLSDPQGAVEALGKALNTRPDDLLLRKMRMQAYDLLEERGKAAEEARALLSHGGSGEDAAPLHFRLAEHALVSGDHALAQTCLMDAIAASSGSIAADAILEDLLLDETRHAERIERREARAAGAERERANRWLLEAAQIAAHELHDAERARGLFERAEQQLPGQPEVARAAYAAALSSGDPSLTQLALRRLLDLELEAHERAAVLHHAVDSEASDEAARELLRTAVVAVSEHTPLAHLARLRAAEAKDFGLLAQAHEALAVLSARDDDTVAHLSAAARAQVRRGDLVAARELLERALTRDGTHPYAMSLMEEVLRRLGEDEALIALLRRTAESREAGEQAESALIAAGLSAERAKDPGRARELYEEAAQKAKGSVSPLFCLLQLAELSGDAAQARAVQRRLAELEQERGEAGIEGLLAHEGLEEQTEEALARLSASLDNPKVAAHAAFALVSGKDASTDLREGALELLAARTEGNQRGLVTRELLSMALLGAEPHARILDLSDEVLTLIPNDPWAAFVKSSVPLPHDEDGHAATLQALADSLSDPRVKRALSAEATWSRRLLRTGALDGDQRSVDMNADLARVVLQTGSLAHDSDLRVRALGVLGEEAEGEERRELALSLVRAQLAAGEGKLALDTVDAMLRETPDDLVVVELRRVAGRAAGDFRAVVEAAEALAQEVTDELSLDLLEEAAMVRMDELSDLAGAEHIFTRVLGRAPTRPVAYARLREIYSARKDTSELVTLVRSRTEHVHDADELVKLFYELARLYRARGELSEALDAIDNVLMLEEHVGALALAAEIHTSREEWEEAVASLESMAGAAGVPRAQRRLCRLGAANFLEQRLGRPGDALSQLTQLRAEGHRDTPLLLRIADVAERAALPERAVEALRTAAETERPAEKAALLIRVARLYRDDLGNPDLAANTFGEALTSQPRSRDAMRELWALTQDDAALRRFQHAVRATLTRAPSDPDALRDLALWAELANDSDAAFTALLALNVLGHADEDERRSCDASLKVALSMRPTSGVKLSTSDLGSLVAEAPSAPYVALLRCVFSAAGELDQLEPGKFGVGRAQRIGARDRSPLRDEAEAMCATLGVSLDDVYQGGNDLLRIVAIPREEVVSLVFGAGVSAPLGATRRNLLALQLAAYQLHSLPLLTRSSAQAARLVWASLVAAECLPVPPRPIPGWAEEDLGDLPRTLAKVLPRKVRKALPELYRALPDQGIDMSKQCALVLRQTRRTALLLAGDLQAALDEAVGALPNRETIESSPAALDLLRTWTSSPLSLLRKKLGLAK